MRILLDTNILVRTAEPGTQACTSALTALGNMSSRDLQPCIVPQKLYEYWVVSTRPTSQNGLGFTIAQAESDISRLKALFNFLKDERAIFEQWNAPVVCNGVSGRNAHDARLVAAMQRHSVTHILTFNKSDFTRYPHIIVLTPEDLL